MVRSAAVLTAAVLAAAAPAWAQTPAAPPRAREASVGVPPALVEAARAPAHVAYTGEQVIVTWDGRNVSASLVRIEYDPAGWSRLDYRAVGPAGRWTVWRRGADEIRFDPLRRTGSRTTRLPIDGDAMTGSHLPWLMENYRISTRPDSLLGRRATRMDFVPLAGDRPARRIDVDNATGVVLRSERLGPAGRIGETTIFLAFEVKPVGWRSGEAPPSDLRLVERPAPRPAGSTASGYPPLRVALPTGFHKVGEYLTAGSDPVRQTVYSDGAATLVVYQRRGAVAAPPQGSRVVNTAGGPVWVHTFGLRTLVHWAHDGRIVTVVGDVSPQSLLTTAERTGVASTPRLWDRLVAWVAHLIASL